jgi:hypothetical protein
MQIFDQGFGQLGEKMAFLQICPKREPLKVAWRTLVNLISVVNEKVSNLIQES